jgi:hypothetical protein
VVGRIAAHLGA